MLDPAETQDSGHSGAVSVVVDTLAASQDTGIIHVSQKPFRDSRHDKDTFCYESIGTTNGHRLGLSSIQPV